MPVADREAVLRDKLREDWEFYAPRALKIADPVGQIVQFQPKAAQLKLWRALRAQQDAGLPMRAAILKARKLGFSTMAQGLLIQRATQRPNHYALVVAQDSSTAGALFDMGRLMWAHLPSDPALRLKPAMANERNTGTAKFMLWGQPAKSQRHLGHLGLNSQLQVDTANEFEASRGLTIHSLHASEVAFWRHPKKLISLLNAVPDEPGTLVLQESTANGVNHFKDTWDRAVAGESDYAAVFVAWHEEPGYQRPFRSADEREEFVESIGKGPYGEDEPNLVEVYGCSPEQLHWRRAAITNRTEGSVLTFHQEYPSSPEEAFLSTGKQVFSLILLQRARGQVEQVAEPEVGKLEQASTKRILARRHTTLDIPATVKFRPLDAGERGNTWQVWEMPVQARVDLEGKKVPAGQYIVAVDVMGGEDREDREVAWNAIEVIDHRTLCQVAEYRSREDSDELAIQCLLAGLFWNGAWVAVERTGGWGLPVARRLGNDFHYPFVYRLPSHAERVEHEKERFGWDTNRQTKPILEDGAKELLREGTHGIRSGGLLAEMFTYVDLGRGKHGPERNKSSDRLMAWMIAQQVAREKPIRSERRGPTVTSTKRRLSTVTGY